MNTIDYFGKELVLRPINKIRVRFRDGKWHVEYRAKLGSKKRKARRRKG